MQGEGGSARETISEPQLFAAKSVLSIGVGHFQGGLLTPLQNFFQAGLGFQDELVGRRRGDPECGGDLGFGVAVRVQEKGSLLPGREGLEGGVEVELGEELLLLLVGQGFLDFQLSGAEGLGPLLDFAQVEVTDTLAAQRRIPSRDPDRRRLQNNKAQIPMDLSLRSCAP